MTLADRIEQGQEEICQAWIARIRDRLGRERTFSEIQLVDSLSLFLPEVVNALRAPAGAAMPSFVAQAHGGQRHVIGADIGEVVLEYWLLYDVLAQMQPTADELSLLTRFLFSAAADAAKIHAQETAASLRKRSWEHFAFVAHEIRNPLVSARFASELLGREVSSSKALAALGRSLAALSGIVDEALMEARMTVVGVEPRRELVQLDRLVGEMVEDAHYDAQAHNLTVELETLPVTANADPRLLRSAFSNLLRNAIKFTPAGLTVRVTMSKAESQCVIQVADQCGGLPPGRAEQLFAAFLQGGSNRSGFGLGLAIARQAVEAHGGTLQVKDVPNHGCIFSIVVPVI